MLRKKQIDKYFSNGYLKIKKYYDNNQLRLIRDEIENISSKQQAKIIFEKDSDTIRSIMSFHKDSELFRNLFAHDLNKLVEKILEEKVYIYQSKINIKSGNEKGKKWDYHRGATFWKILDGVRNMNMCSVFIYVTKQTKNNGCVFALEKSHLGIDTDTILRETKIISSKNKSYTADALGLQIKSRYLNSYMKNFKKIYLTGDPGDILFMHPNLIHASENNRSEKKRTLIIPVYNTISDVPKNSQRPNYLCEKI